MPTPPRQRRTARIAIVQTPREHGDPDEWAALVTRWRDFRLHALRAAPDAFSSTYAREAAFERGVWEERLRNPVANMFVAVVEQQQGAGRSRGEEEEDASGVGFADGGGGGGEGNGVSLLLSAPWVGVVVGFGPREERFVQQVTKSPWESVSSGAEPRAPAGEPAVVSDAKELFCHMNAVFVDTDYRGLGIAKTLIERASTHAEELGRQAGAGAVCCTILVDKENTAAASLYEKCGFEGVGEETMVSPRKERLDSTSIPEHEIQVVKMAKWTRL